MFIVYVCHTFDSIIWFIPSVNWEKHFIIIFQACEANKERSIYFGLYGIRKILRSQQQCK